MGAAIEGALIGGALGLLLVAVEYFFIRKAIKDRSQRLHRVAEIDPSERKRLYTLASFCATLPFGFAFFFWLVWG
jgi:hypothetical protein